MKFAEALAMALWLSLFAQIRCDYFIEIAKQDSEKVKHELGSDSESEIAGGPYVCKTVTYTGKPNVKYVEECKSIRKEATTYVEEKKKRHSRTGKAVRKVQLLSHVFRQDAMRQYLHANFIMIGEAQLRDHQWLKLDGISVKKAPSVILVGYHQSTLDSPRFLPKDTCDTTADLANSPVFEGYLPEDEERRDDHIRALTGLFCCSDVPSCYPNYEHVLKKGYLSALWYIMNTALTNAREFVVDTQVEAGAINQGTLERYKSFSYDAEKATEVKGGGAKDGKKLSKSESTGTAKRGWYAVTKSFRKSLKRRWGGSSKGSPVGSPTSSPLRSGYVSPARSGSASPTLSRAQSESFGDVDIGSDLGPEARTKEEEALMAKKQRKAQLETVIKILLNTMIDPCILLSSKFPAAETELKSHCQLYCEFLRTAAILFKATKTSCGELRSNFGRCSQSNKACLCSIKSPKTLADTLKGSNKKVDFVWKEVKMSFCDNALRNNLTPISQCV
ncbi:unnamed protein product [Bemisia tabaci]|uniref:Uncharacterized protein n=1 Tax=Bemisia tabaci TaxID=7038 RepID=A0A9P0C6F9_BEMTA|nr:unnamed protein product [Bemisia tabaci]